MLALRSNYLVYIPLNKHASTSFVYLFRDKLGWQTDFVSAIDWQKDCVFAHMMHPAERHLRGVTEAIGQYRLFDLLDHSGFCKLLGTAFFDIHSYPLSVCLGSNVLKIDWLVLDHHSVQSDDITKKFLQHHGVEIDLVPRQNVSDPAAIAMRNKIKCIREQNQLTSTLLYMYQLDYNLYNRVLRGFDFDGMESKSWNEISWLRTV